MMPNPQSPEQESMWSGAAVRRALRTGTVLGAAMALSWLMVPVDSMAGPKKGPPQGGLLIESGTKKDDAATTSGLKTSAYYEPQRLIEIKESKELKKVKHGDKDYTFASFGFLANFPYKVVPDSKLKDKTELPTEFQGQVPKGVKELDGKLVAVQGFMIPLEVRDGGVRSFVLVRSQLQCCFGAIPEMNEWIHVKVTGKEKLPVLRDDAITVYGTMGAGELIEKGALISLYRMDATALEKADL